MHRKILTGFLLILLGLFLPACTQANAPLSVEEAATETIPPISASITPQVEPSTTSIVASETPAAPPIESTLVETQNSPGEKPMTPITISVNDSSFSAKLYDNETTRALLAQFPLNLHMSELNGREKFYDLPADLPAASTEKPETIQSGEIMLWSSNTLVLFYNTFSNSYGGYVRLGYIEDVTGLADALGSGNAQVTFTISN